MATEATGNDAPTRRAGPRPATVKQVLYIKDLVRRGYGDRATRARIPLDLTTLTDDDAATLIDDLRYTR